MADLPRSASDVEKTVVDILGDLQSGRVDAPVARNIRDAAEGRIKASEQERAVHRAINRP